jgi:hypothetical protein
VNTAAVRLVLPAGVETVSTAADVGLVRLAGADTERAGERRRDGMSVASPFVEIKTGYLVRKALPLVLLPAMLSVSALCVSLSSRTVICTVMWSGQKARVGLACHLPVI